MDMMQNTRERQLKKYEFGKTVKFTIEQVRAINQIFNEYLLVLTSELSLQLRTTVKATARTMNEMTYGEYIESLGKVTMLGIYNFLPIERPLFVSIEPEFGFIIIDNMCGGQLNFEQKEREITSLDKKLILTFLTNIIERFERQWVNVIPGARMGFMVMETSPLFYHTIPEKDAVFVVDVNISIGDYNFTIKYAFPYLTIGDRLLDYLARRNNEMMATLRNEEHQAALQDRINNSEVMLSAILGHSDISYGQLKAIKEGDVIPLKRKTTDEIELLIQGEPYFKVRSGISDNHFAVQVISKIEKE